MTFLELAEEVLKTAKEHLTYREIWEIAISQGLDKKVGTKGKTPTDTLAARIYTDMKEKAIQNFALPANALLLFGLNPEKMKLKT